MQEHVGRTRHSVSDNLIRLGSKACRTRCVLSDLLLHTTHCPCTQESFTKCSVECRTRCALSDLHTTHCLCTQEGLTKCSANISVKPTMGRLI